MKAYPSLLLLLLIGATCAEAQDPTSSPQAHDHRMGDSVQIQWHGQWYPGRVLAVEDGRYRVRYDGYGEEWDEWVTSERLRPPVDERDPAPTAPAAPPTEGGRAFGVGDRVEARPGFSVYFDAVVTEVTGGRFRVRYDDGTEGWVEDDAIRPLPVSPALTAAVPPGQYQCWQALYTYTYMGSFRIEDHSTYRYLTGQQQRGSYRYDPRTGRIDWLSGELDGRLFEGEMTFNRNSDDPMIKLHYRDDQGREVQQHCRKVD